MATHARPPTGRPGRRGGGAGHGRAAAAGPAADVDREPVAPTWTVSRELVARTTRIELTDGWDTTLPDGGRTLGTRRTVVEVGDDDPTTCRARTGERRRGGARRPPGAGRGAAGGARAAATGTSRSTSACCGTASRTGSGAGASGSRATSAERRGHTMPAMPARLAPGAYAALPTFFDADDAVDTAAIAAHVAPPRRRRARRRAGLRLDRRVRGPRGGRAHGGRGGRHRGRRRARRRGVQVGSSATRQSVRLARHAAGGRRRRHRRRHALLPEGRRGRAGRPPAGHPRGGAGACRCWRTPSRG